MVRTWAWIGGVALAGVTTVALATAGTSTPPPAASGSETTSKATTCEASASGAASGAGERACAPRAPTLGPVEAGMGEAGETTRDERRPIADHVDGQPSRSHGTPWRGWIDNGVRLEESEHIRYVDSDVEAGRFWGTEELVGMIERAADRVASIRPGARLTVGELSKKGGGHVRGHRSHESGRDVDLGFYLLNEEGGSVETKWFIPVEPSGHASWGGPVRFDDRRNWLLLESLLTDPQAHVKWVFVAPALRRRLLNEAERRGVDSELYERASRILAPPVPDVNPHNNHFHVRIYCPADDVPDCRDERPYWPWLPASHPFARR